MPKNVNHFAAGALALVTVIALSACSVNDSAPGSSTESAAPVTAEIALVSKDESLSAEVPASFKDRELVMGVSEFSPYINFESDGTITGLIPDLNAQLASLLGITIKVQKSTFDSTLTGIEAGRFDLSAPAGDFLERQQKVDFVDFAQSNVTVLVKKSTGFMPSSSSELCGKKVGVEKGTGTQNVVAAVSENCTKAGQAALEVNAFSEKNAEVLALQSERIDVIVAPSASNQSVEAESGQMFTTIKLDDMQNLPAATATYGIMMKKSTGLADVLAKAVKKLEAQGTYAALFDKWGIPLSKIESSRMLVNGSQQYQAK
jgi:polar amino acid transport system substrate-binding protein